jgi:sugar/nucleoside kinase (ribokinase family)
LIKTFDFFCIGGASVDLILKTSSLPVSGEKQVVDFLGEQAGGLVANTACAAARLGLRSAWMGMIADDRYGEIIRKDFIQFGVDTSHAQVIAGARTDFTVILLEPSGERTILVVPTMPSPPVLDAAALDALRQTRMIYTIPFGLDWIDRLADKADAVGSLLALDVEASSPIQGDELNAALSRSDLVFCSLLGLQLALGTEDPQDGAQNLLDLGISCVVVTMGSKGAWGFTSNQVFHQPALVVPVVDTTGAGDCFHAAFAYGYLAGWPLEKTLDFAVRAASQAVQELGPRAGYPTAADIMNRKGSEDERYA